MSGRAVVELPALVMMKPFVPVTVIGTVAAAPAVTEKVAAPLLAMVNVCTFPTQARKSMLASTEPRPFTKL